MDISASFGERLRAKRTDRGWTLKKLAGRSEIHWTYLGQVERGQRNVSLHTIVRLAEALGIDPGALVVGLRVQPDARGREATGDALG